MAARFHSIGCCEISTHHNLSNRTPQVPENGVQGGGGAQHEAFWGPECEVSLHELRKELEMAQPK